MYAKFGKNCKIHGQIIFVTPPIVSWISPDVIIGTGNTLTVSVSSNGTPPIVYQWRNGPIPILGATSNFLILPSVTTDNTGLYNCVLSSNKATVYSSDITVTVLQSLQLASQTTALTGIIDATATLSVSAIGAETITYQWYKDGVATSGTGASYNIFPVSTNSIGSYQCVVTNQVSQVSSAAIPLTAI